MRRFFLLLGVSCLVLAAAGVHAQVPPTPHNLVAQVAPTGVPGVDLTWQMPMTSMMGRVLFKINRSTDDSVHFGAIGVTDHMFYRDWLIFPGHTYYYTVNSFVIHDSTILESPPSNIAWATVGVPVPRPHGVISGVVTDSLSGRPLPFVRMLFYRESAGLHAVRQTWTDPWGNYLAVLDTGTYRIKAQPTLWMPWLMFPLPLYLPEWYKDAADAADATPVVVSDGSQFTADINLERVKPPLPATVSGTVTDSSGNPLKGALVALMRPLPEMPFLDANGVNFPGIGDEGIDVDDISRMCGVFGKALTDSLGHYTAHVVAGRAYIAMAIKRGYLPQFFDHKEDPRDADIIRLNKDTTGIDFALIPRPLEANSIAGIVRDSAGMGVASRIILIPLVRPWHSRFGSTDSVGAYTITHVRAGRYFVLAIPLREYAPAFYKAGAYGVLRWKDADTVQIAGAVTGIDIGVVPIHGDGPTTLAGMIVSEGIPVPGVNVFATDPQGRLVGYGLTDGGGAYSMDGLQAGQIAIVADREGFNSAQSTVNIGPSDFSVNGGTLSLTAVVVTSVPGQAGVPDRYVLEQNYPNPFNPMTSIEYSIPVGTYSSTSLRVYDLLGREVAVLVNEAKGPGSYKVKFDASGLASGVYLYRLQSGKFVETKKLLLLR